MTETKQPITSARLFGELVEALKGRPPEIQQRVTAHVMADSGHATLVNYAQNGASEQEKIRMYATLLIALKDNKWENLKGQVPRGQSDGKASQTSQGVSNPQPTVKRSTAPAPAPPVVAKEPAKVPEMTRSTVFPEVKPAEVAESVGKPSIDPVTAAMEALRNALQPASQAGLTEQQVRAIVQDEVAKMRSEVGLFLRERFVEAKCELAKGLESDVDARLSTIAEAIEKAVAK